ncbi:MAG: IS630 family transposase [Gemmatimonadales bacterium]
MPVPILVVLAAPVRAELAAIARSTRTPAGLGQRARLILALADGASYTELTARWGIAATSISRWKRRFTARGIAGLQDAPRRGRPDRLAPAVEARILALTQQAPPKPLTHWSVRRMAARTGVSPATVQRVWARAGLQPHRLEHYVTSPDPEFERKATDILGLYLHPPAHAAVFCIDEKTAIQALDRRDPVLPRSPGWAERPGFEYARHGTLSLYAALEVGTGHVEGRTVARHPSAAFVAFLDQVRATQPKRRNIQVICDNPSAHKTRAVREWLATHPRVRMHYTPTSSSWLNQVELWFAKIERDCIARGIFTSTPDLRRKLMQYIRLHNKTCRPFQWAYRAPKHRIRTSAA